MNDGTPENPLVAKNASLPAARIAESDYRPIRNAADAADLNMSVVIRECLIRYGQQTIIELVQDREFQASGSYNSPGRRRLRQSPKARDIALGEMVSWKFKIAEQTAVNWIKLGRIEFDGTVIEDPAFQVPADAKDRVTKASA